MRILVASALAVLVASVSFAQIIPPDLQKAVDARRDAQRGGDDQTWGRFTTDDFMVVTPEGRVGTKASRMGEIKGRKSVNPPPKVTESRYRFYGDTAVATSVQEDPGGPTRFTVLWVKQSGQWRVASVHQTRIAKQ